MIREIRQLFFHGSPFLGWVLPGPVLPPSTLTPRVDDTCGRRVWTKGVDEGTPYDTDPTRGSSRVTIRSGQSTEDRGFLETTVRSVTLCTFLVLEFLPTLPPT